MSFDWAILRWIQNTLVCPAMNFLMPKITLLGNGGAVVLGAAIGLVTCNAGAKIWPTLAKKVGF